MRLAFVAAGLAALAFAQAASAGQVAIAPVAFAPAFQATVERDIGSSQGDVLRNRVSAAIGDALARRGVVASSDAPVTIEADIVNAVPNRVPIQRLRSHYMLDPGRSVQLGGAELHAVLRASNGAVLSEVVYSRYDERFADLLGPPAMWTSATHTINQFAERVADAYVAQTAAH
ncbi:MAG: hypothetical protein HY054_04780 [Proteobacteria bacterium]|nr:hypothetical protein [Pseudomonadota bacterium]